MCIDIPKDVIVVIGGQYGSEAKGKHVQDICHERKEIKTVVRTGAPNAGHSMAVFEPEGRGPAYVALQILPCGWTAKNVENLFVGAGAQVIPEMLQKEANLIKEHGSPAHIVVDHRAMIQTQGDADAENAVGMSNKIGSTGKGCGAALIRRVTRNDPEYKDYGAFIDASGDENLPEAGWVTERLQNRDLGMIIVEGTQGAGLSMIHGPYPFTTSRDTHTAQWLSEAGISPLRVAEIHMVCRTFPIRVAGNSGPMEDEIGWDHFFEAAGLDPVIIDSFRHEVVRLQNMEFDSRTLVREACINMEEKWGESWGDFRKIMEFTTVTKLPRRIGRFDWAEFDRNVSINRPTHVALEFCNYVTAKSYGIQEVTPLMEYVNAVDGAPIKLGKMNWMKFNEICEANEGMEPLLAQISDMNQVLQKWGAGAVTHLGIARNATLVLDY